MNERTIPLVNTTWWDTIGNYAVEMHGIRIVLIELPFVMRQVRLSFAAGPKLDLSFFDMDRIAVDYLRMRGVVLPAEIENRTTDKYLAGRDLSVRKNVVPILTRDCLPRLFKKKRCARCLQTQEYNGDWYGDLCPPCADETEPNK